MSLVYRQPIDRRPGLLLTVLVHAALLAGWQMLRTLPAPAAAGHEVESRVLWIPLPPPLPARRLAAPDKEAAPQRRQAPHAPSAPVFAPSRTPSPPATAPAIEATPAPTQPADTKPNAQQILERAKRDVGSIAKALRKENNPYIAAPLDSPQIRLQRGIEQANAMAPNRIWEAPKVEELVNNTGDGARRTRVISGNGSYCVTERATNTNVEMIEMHGKIRLTNCPTHEEPSKQQAWRTLRD